MKTCTECHKEKPIDGFYIARNKPIAACKECTRKRAKTYAILNKERDKQARVDYRASNSGAIVKRVSEWNKRNVERRKEIARNWAKNFREQNREKYLSYASEWKKKKRANDPKYKVNTNMRAAIWQSLNGKKKCERWQNAVGYSITDLQLHLERQFKEGMTWDNYGEWHIDHKMPLVSFNFKNSGDVEFKQCWSLENLQPLWAIDNLKKHAKIQP